MKLVITLATVLFLSAAAQADDELDSLSGSYRVLVSSLRSSGGLGPDSRPAVEGLRDRIASYNARTSPATDEGLAMELQLSMWLGEHELVHELFDRLTTQTHDVEIGLAWARYFRRLDDRPRVGEAFDRLTELFPGEVSISIGWADYFIGVNHYARALRILQEAEIDPVDHPEAARKLSDCLFAEHRFQEAVEALEAIPSASIEDERLLGVRREYVDLWVYEQDLRASETSANDLPLAELTTTQGRIVVELFENQAPNTVANFIALAESGFYDDTRFHRVLPNFMAQGGDPNTKPGEAGTPGTGGPGYRIADEYDREDARNHFTGSLSMANEGPPNTGGSQFFITHTPTPHLNGKHTVFGRVLEGEDVVRSLKPDDDLETVVILRKRDHEYNPEKLAAAPRAPIDIRSAIEAAK